jgi:hypothetical protein
MLNKSFSMAALDSYNNLLLYGRQILIKITLQGAITALQARLVVHRCKRKYLIDCILPYWLLFAAVKNRFNCL